MKNRWYARSCNERSPLARRKWQPREAGNRLPTDLNRTESAPVDRETGYIRELGLFDSAMIVIGAMIGSGIFIVPADMARNIGSPGWLLVAWLFTALVTVAAALSYGQLAAMMPKAGGMYIDLREAFT